jgi:cytochrome P450
MLPPGPKLPLALQTIAVWRYWDRYLMACRRRYGDVFTVRIFPFGPLVYVADPEAIKTVFTGKPHVFHAGEANSFMTPVLGPRSVLTSDEDDHLRRRKLTSPMFHGEAVRHYASVVEEIADDEIDRWRAGETIALHPRMRDLTFEVILRAVFGVTDERRLAELRAALPPVTEIAGLNMLVFVWPQLEKVWPFTRWVAKRDAADALLYDEIRRRRSDPAIAERRDVLSLLLQAGDMDDAEVRDHLMTLLLAGHETTATALAWAFERLLRTPDVLQRATDAAHAGDDDYLDAVVREVLRVRPIIFDVIRTLQEPVEIGGYELPAGVTVGPAIGLVQRDPRLYEDPYALRPERDAPAPYTWIPFGGGVRRCLGAAFAQMEMRVVIAAILRRALLRAPEPQAERTFVRHVTLVPAKGARVVVERVSARTASPAAPSPSARPEAAPTSLTAG